MERRCQSRSQAAKDTSATRVRRFKKNTPLGVVMADYYRQVAEGAKEMGKPFKAWVFSKKASKALKKAGGMELTI